MKKKVLVMGNGNKWQVNEKLVSLGYEPVFVLYSEPKSFDFEYVVISKEQAASKTYDLSVFEPYTSQNIQGLIVCSEWYVEMAAELREKYFPQLEYLDVNQIDNIRDKLFFKRTLNQYKIPTTKFSEITPESSYPEIKKILGTSFLLKPRKGLLAKGIAIISCLNDWESWVGAQKDATDQFYAEEYLQDIKEYCCDTIVVDGNIVAMFPGEYTVDCLKSNKIHCGIGVNFPGFLPESKINELKNIVAEFIKLHGIRNSFCHIEFFYHEGVWKFGEVGCRPAGGYQMPTESYIVDHDLIFHYLKTFLKSENVSHNTFKVKRPYVGYYLYPKKIGLVKKITTNLKLPWILESKIYVKEQQVLDYEDSSVTMAASIVYEADSIEELREHSELVPQLIQIEMG
jgi:hypothetical protein